LTTAKVISQLSDLNDSLTGIQSVIASSSKEQPTNSNSIQQPQIQLSGLEKLSD